MFCLVYTLGFYAFLFPDAVKSEKALETPCVDLYMPTPSDLLWPFRQHLYQSSIHQAMFKHTESPMTNVSTP